MPTAFPSLRSIAKIVFTSAQLAFVPANLVRGGVPQSCPSPQLSCHNTTVVADTCCFNAPGGQLLLTQFWDTNPSTGPSNSWTVHGLWPDRCDGTYDAYCDPSREYTNITAILQSYGQTALLNYMNLYWKDANGSDETFWEHEWGKHGTCISTLSTKCFTSYTAQEEVVDYFNTTVNLYQTLDSYAFLSAAGIVPSATQTYTSAAIIAALKAPRGFIPVIRCASGAINEIWYFFDVRGSVVTGQFVPADPVGATSSCPVSGVKYLPKSGVPVTSTTVPATSTTTATATSTATGTPGTPFAGSGYLIVTSGGTSVGCIISAGTWYTTGTCATFAATASGPGSTLKSSKGNCAIVNGALSCSGSNTNPTIFTNSYGNLAFSGSSTFYANSVPTGQQQSTVFTTSHAASLTIAWQAI